MVASKQRVEPVAVAGPALERPVDTSWPTVAGVRVSPGGADQHRPEYRAGDKARLRDGRAAPSVRPTRQEC
jgi:hypothetical protein